MADLIKIHPDGREELKDGGAMCNAIAWNEDDTFKEIAGHEPIVGCSMQVGSINGRTYSNQDWWLTTRVTKILEKIEKKNRTIWIFETENSKYKLIK